MSLEKDNPKLINFFIFYSKLGQQEGLEHEKLLYYYPKSDNLDCQIRNVGLSEAITRFTNTFNKNEDCESLHTQKAHQIFYQAEPSLWLIMTISVGWIRRQKESGFVKEYLGGSIQDEVLSSHLKKAYTSFRFQNLSILKILKNEIKSTLIETLRVFFDDHLTRNDLAAGDIVNVWRGVSFLPLDKQCFLRVHAVLSLLKATFPLIVHTAFLFRDQFAWCGFNMEDFKALSEYVHTKLSQNLLESYSTTSGQSSKSFKCSSRFIGEDTSPNNIVYLRDENQQIQPHRLLMYVLAGVTVCLSFPLAPILPPIDLEKIANLLESSISQLASDIGEQCMVKSDGFRFLYHNHMNLATKSSLHGLNALPLSTMQTILDMHQDLLRVPASDLTVKTSSDYWIVGKCSNGRESYIILNHKVANLVEVSDEVEKMCSSEFESIFMVD